MKPWRLLLAVALATVAVLLLTSFVVAAPASTTAVQTNQVYDDPDPIMTGTVQMTHPVGIVIAVYSISLTRSDGLQIRALASATLRRLSPAAASQGVLTPTQVMAARRHGLGAIKRLRRIRRKA
jgi:hypothetical protein